MYAIVKIGGSQYKITPGQILEVDKLADASFSTNKLFEIKQTLLVCDGENTQIGQPYLSDFKVVGKVLKQFQGKKLRVARFKSKVRYRKVTGFRPQLTQIRIESVGGETQEVGNTEALNSSEKLKETEKLKEAEKKTVKKATRIKKTV